MAVSRSGKAKTNLDTRIRSYAKVHLESGRQPYVPARYGAQLGYGRRPAAIRSRPLAMAVARPRRLINSLMIKRAERHMTQRQLAVLVGISCPGLSAIETGKSVPSVGTALVLAEALETTVHDIFRLDSAYDADATARYS